MQDGISRHRRRDGRARRRSYRALAEPMEDRLLLAATITVNSLLDANDGGGSAEDDVLTLREAILVANGTLDVSSLSPLEQAQVVGTPGTGAADRDTIAFAIPTGPVTEFVVPTPASKPQGITAGPDGNLWFIEEDGNQIGRITPQGVVTEFAIPTPGSEAQGITLGPDGNLWFTEPEANQIGRITPQGVITEFPIPTTSTFPYSIVAGPDGNLWFTQLNTSSIGRITPAGVVTEFPTPTPGSFPFFLTAGPDGNVWFTEAATNQIGRITPAGVITEFPIPTANSTPEGITAGPDGALWFTQTSPTNGNLIGRITTDGAVTDEFPLPTPNSTPLTITTGPDGNLWFTQFDAGQIGRITTDGVVTEFPTPTPDSQPYAITTGPDGDLWFTEAAANRIGRFTFSPDLTIRPLSQLPILTDAVVIDAFSQGGLGYDGPPLIEIDGSLAGQGVNGLWITAGDSVVQGMAINGFQSLPNPSLPGDFLGGHGILIQAGGGNLIRGNFIGTDITGTLPRGNQQDGISIQFSAGNVIGGTTPADRNVISANLDGIVMADSDSTSNVVQGNLIGTDVTGAQPMGNTRAGVILSALVSSGGPAASGNTIGGAIPEARNVISANAQGGVIIRSPFGGGSGNVIQGNFIGTDINGALPLGNGGNGVFIDGAGTTVPGSASGNEVLGNLISANLAAGVRIEGAIATANLVAGNRIGTDDEGTAPLGNADSGVEIVESPGNTIGGATAGDRNIISANNEHGIEITGANATGNVVIGNYLGLDAGGSADLGNRISGILLDDVTGTTVGGETAGERNVLSGNGEHGIILLNATDTMITGNFIGTNADGDGAVGNDNQGIFVGNGSTGTTIGGTTPIPGTGPGNVISGNGVEAGGGIAIFSGSAGNVVLGNILGADATGTAPLGNSAFGIALAAAGTVVGGGNAGDGNLISGNLGDGVQLNGVDGARVQGNLFGTEITGTSALGNGGAGVRNTLGTNNAIGGIAAGEGNTIAFNGGSGVVVVSGTGNAILGNAIFTNGGLGIDLGNDGVTPNDQGDPDPGPNNLQNFPVLTSVVSAGGTTTLQGTLNSLPDRTFWIELFNDAGDLSGFGEGRVLLGITAVTTDSNGDGTFSLSMPSPSSPLPRYSATATIVGDGIFGDTSEFSAALTVFSDLAVTVADSPDPEPVAVGQEVTYVVNVTNNGPGDAPSALLSNALPAGATFVSVVTTQGTATQSGGLVTVDFGTLDVGTTATVTIVVIPTAPGTLLNTATVTSALMDPNGTNNTATESTLVELPGSFAFSMEQYAVAEDVAGGVAEITVTRTGGAGGTVSVDVSTTDGTAIAGRDYLPPSPNPLTLTFAPGQVEQTFTITILDDLAAEGDVTVNLALDIPTSGVRGTPSTATLTILNDDELVVTNTNDSGPGSLREAILVANNTEGRDGITFAIEGPGPHTIAPLSPLPAILDPLFLDGRSQPGYEATPVIELAGHQLRERSLFGNGLTIAAPLTHVSGLAINRFPGAGIRVVGADQMILDSSFVGTDPSGRLPMGNGAAGLLLLDSSRSVIGLPVPELRNVISANGGFGGIAVFDLEPAPPPDGELGPDTTDPAASNLIQNNRIGTDVTGTRDLGNATGILLSGAILTQVGGGQFTQRNLISGNGTGIVLTDGATRNRVVGNDLGTTITGAAALGNDGAGIVVKDPRVNPNGGGGSSSSPGLGSTGNQIVGNLISGNRSGVELGVGAFENIIEGNAIGTDAARARPLPNQVGVFVNGAADNRIGSPAEGAGNVLSGNALSGVRITGADATGNLVVGNRIGTNPDGTARVPNGFDGVFLQAPDNAIVGNLISGNGSVGIQLFSSLATGNLVGWNRIGTDAAGLAPLGNARDGVFFNQAPGNTLVGNVISANTSVGVQLFGDGTAGNVLDSNRIGTNAGGQLARGLGNNFGLFLNTRSANTLGTTNRIAGNRVLDVFVSPFLVNPIESASRAQAQAASQPPASSPSGPLALWRARRAGAARRLLDARR